MFLVKIVHCQMDLDSSTVAPSFLKCLNTVTTASFTGNAPQKCCKVDTQPAIPQSASGINLGPLTFSGQFTSCHGAFLSLSYSICFLQNLSPCNLHIISQMSKKYHSALYTRQYSKPTIHCFFGHSYCCL